MAWLLQRSNLSRGVNRADAAIRTVVTDIDTVGSPGMTLMYRRAAVSFIHELYRKYRETFSRQAGTLLTSKVSMHFRHLLSIYSFATMEEGFSSLRRAI